MTAELRRNLILAFVGLAGGFGLIVALFGSAELLKRPFAPAGHETAPAAPGASATKPGESAALPAISGDGGKGASRPGTGEKPQPDPSAAPKAEGNKAGGTKADADPKAPSFDLVRVEPTGETVVAGRGLPNTAVEMLVNGKPVAKVLADPNGQFALVPPALAPGNSEIVLRLTDQQGRETRSPQSVAVVVSPDRKARPLVALSSPDSPTVVLSQPETVASEPAQPNPSAAAKPAQGAVGAPAQAARAPAPGEKSGQTPAGQTPAGKPPTGTADASAKTPPALKIVSVDAQEGGRLYVTGRATPGATVRLYLNDTLVAPASVGPDGKVVFTIGKGVAAGDYRVRIDQVDSVTGKVRTRAEVALTVPESVARVASREPASEGSRIGPANATAGKATTAVPPPGAKPESGSAAAQPRREAGPVAAIGSNETAAASGAPVLAGRPESPAAQRRDQPAGQASEATKRSPERAAANTAATKPADALAAGSASAETSTAAPGSAFVAEIATARITRGDSLWQISRKAYGSGIRYTVIYDANQEQIRDPDRIFPGQIFVLPKDEKGGRG